MSKSSRVKAREQANGPAKTSSTGSKGSSTPWIWASVAAVVVVAIVGAVALSGGDDELVEGTAPAASGSAEPGATRAPSTRAEVQPVTITGTPLPPQSDDPAAADPGAGLAAPTLVGYAHDGTPVDIAYDHGGPTMLVFLAHWCGHCNAEIPELNNWKAVGNVPDGMEVVGIATSVQATAPNFPPSEWLADKQWEWPVLADSRDSDAAAAFGLTGFPYIVIVDADGTVLKRWSGQVGQLGLEQRIAEALGT